MQRPNPIVASRNTGLDTQPENTSQTALCLFEAVTCPPQRIVVSSVVLRTIGQVRARPDLRALPSQLSVVRLSRFDLRASERPDHAIQTPIYTSCRLTRSKRTAHPTIKIHHIFRWPLKHSPQTAKPSGRVNNATASFSLGNVDENRNDPRREAQRHCGLTKLNPRIAFDPRGGDGNCDERSIQAFSARRRPKMCAATPSCQACFSIVEP